MTGSCNTQLEDLHGNRLSDENCSFMFGPELDVKVSFELSIVVLYFLAVQVELTNTFSSSGLKLSSKTTSTECSVRRSWLHVLHFWYFVFNISSLKYLLQVLCIK